jgi:hypothetical protein
MSIVPQGLDPSLHCPVLTVRTLNPGASPTVIFGIASQLHAEKSESRLHRRSTTPTATRRAVVQAQRYWWQFDFLWNHRQLNDGERTIAAIQSAESLTSDAEGPTCGAGVY